MSEVRVVKFNIKTFLDELLCSKVASEDEQYEELLDRFDAFYKDSSPLIRDSVFSFMNTKSIIVSENRGIRKDLTKIVNDFSN